MELDKAKEQFKAFEGTNLLSPEFIELRNEMIEKGIKPETIATCELLEAMRNSPEFRQFVSDTVWYIVNQ